MDANFFPQPAELLRFLPETILTIAGTLLLVVEGYKKEHDSRSSIVTLTAIAIGLAMYGTVVAYQTPGMAFSNMLISDGYAAFFRLVVLSIGLLTVLSSSAYLEREKSPPRCLVWVRTGVRNEGIRFLEASARKESRMDEGVPGSLLGV